MQINQPAILNSENMHSTHVAGNLMHLCNNLKAIRTYVDYIGVAVQERGSLLREMGINTPIIMLGDILCWLSLAGYIGLMVFQSRTEKNAKEKQENCQIKKPLN